MNWCDDTLELNACSAVVETHTREGGCVCDVNAGPMVVKHTQDKVNAYTSAWVQRALEAFFFFFVDATLVGTTKGTDPSILLTLFFELQIRPVVVPCLKRGSVGGG
jgi:hypothetical protein